MKVHKLISVVMALLVFSMPCVTLAQPSEAQQAAIDARNDAKHNVDRFAWGAYGFSCGIIAIPHALIGKPEIPYDRVIGKSPQYVNTYTIVYRQHAKRRRIQAAAIGCGILSAVTTIGSYAVYTAFYTSY